MYIVSIYIDKHFFKCGPSAKDMTHHGDISRF